MKKPLTSIGLSLLAAVFLAGCGEESPTFTAPDRAESARAPQTAACGDPGELRCLLPWPSSAYTEIDPTTETGLRLSVQTSSLQVDDDPRSYALADGFSRLTPIMVGFGAAIDPSSIAASSDGPVHLLLAQHDHPRRGEKVPVRITLTPGEDPTTETLVAAYPLRPLEPGADYVVVVTNQLRGEGGAALQPTRKTEVSVGRAEPASQEEADLRGYHAPARKLLADAGIDAASVLRVFDFTTRSGADAIHQLSAIREASIAAVDAGEVQVVVDKVEIAPNAALAMAVEGRLTGLPSFIEADGDLALDGEGEIMKAGTREAPFRAVVPAGMGDYRFVLYGHGMGGNFTDDSFDELLGQEGIGKVGIRFDGWTDKDLVTTFATLVRTAEASHRIATLGMHAVAAAAAVQHSMSSILGDVLSAAKIDGLDNPAAGRKPDASIPVWAGGSLGGTMGLAYVSMDPATRYGVLNVPGAGWTHFIPGAQTYSTIRGLLRGTYGGDMDVLHGLLMSQTNFDNIDGGAWTGQVPGDPSILLVQESMGDPVLPNEGTDMVSVAADALHLGAVLAPVTGIETGTEAINRSALTQYKVAGGDALDVHGFAARSGPAGDAAREQITSFVKSVWAGQAKITVPSGCTGGSCDFSK
ncbi:MAG: hypothetical protein IPM54_26585 [Polyangiaceae bacterium]|nr:hypothetical protein [Polyangiaceae bacterium]